MSFESSRRNACLSIGKAALLLAGHGLSRSVQARADSPLRLVVQELPPYAYNRRGVPEGLAVDVLGELRRRLRIRRGIEFAPLPRAMDMLLADNREPLVFAPLGRTPFNESRVRWIGMMASNPIMAFRRRTLSPLPTTIEDLRRSDSVAVGRSGSHEAILRSLDFQNLVLARDIVDAYRMVANGEAEYTVAGSLTLNAGLDKLGIASAQIENTGVVISRLDIYVAMSLSVPDAEFERWQAAFDALRRSGRLLQLLKRHFPKPSAR